MACATRPVNDCVRVCTASSRESMHAPIVLFCLLTHHPPSGTLGASARAAAEPCDVSTRVTTSGGPTIPDSCAIYASLRAATSYTHVYNHRVASTCPLLMFRGTCGVRASRAHACTCFFKVLILAPRVGCFHLGVLSPPPTRTRNGHRGIDRGMLFRLKRRAAAPRRFPCTCYC